MTETAGVKNISQALKYPASYVLTQNGHRLDILLDPLGFSAFKIATIL